MGKDIVFAGTRDTWERWRPFFESKGISLHLAEVIAPTPIEDLDQRISSLDPMNISSAIFSSKSSAKILVSSHRGKDLLETFRELGVMIAAVGEGTASILLNHGYKVFSPPIERVETLLKILSETYRRGEIVVFSSDRLEIHEEIYAKRVRKIEVYGLRINREGVMVLENMLRKGVKRIMIASQTVSKILCGVESISRNNNIEVHIMTDRIAEPLIQCQYKGFRLIIHNSSTFREFVMAVVNHILSSPQKDR
ncbi:MAG TPA: uroporphyrinogen-III synthase [Sulfolobales archaeon]|nr:uroporphyrinogen-III synthase [Sulfolobales archaeon]